MRCARQLPLLLALVGCAALAQVDPSPARTAPSPSLPVLPTAEQAAAGRSTPQQLDAAFTAADSDHNEELTRAEAQRLAIAPRAFEDMDANKDGVVSRAEYLDSVR